MDETPTQLRYASQPQTGYVIIDRRYNDGSVTITLLRDRGRVFLGTAWSVIGVVLMALGVVLSPQVTGPSSLNIVFLFLLTGGVGFLIRGVANLFGGLNATSLTIDQDHLTLRRRTIRQIERHVWERVWLADAGVTRMPFNHTLVRPWVLRVTLRNGEFLDLITGREAEIRAAADALRESAGLQKEGWLEAQYPPRPKGARATRVLGTDYLSMTLPPPWVAWRYVLLAAPPLLPAACWVVGMMAYGPHDAWRVGRWDSSWTYVQVLLFWAFGLVAVAGAARKLMPTVMFEVEDGRLVWSESGLFRPGQDDWPVQRVSDVVVTPKRSRRNPGLRLEIEGVGPVDLIRNGKRRDVEWIAETLRTATTQR